jgi:hypothetical protein
MVVRKLAVLLMSQEKFLNGHGNGSCNTASDGNTGTPTSDGAKKLAALFSKCPASPSVDSSGAMCDQSNWKDEDWEKALAKANGSPTETATNPPTSSAPPEGMTQEEALSWLKTLFPPTK